MKNSPAKDARLSVRSVAPWLVTAAMLVLGLDTWGRAAGPKFYPDDPLLREVDTQDAAKVKPYEIDLAYDALENLFAHPGDRTGNVRAQDVNSIDEVPDSSWFNNRAGTRAISVDELLRGPDRTDGPAPGKWTVVSGKSDGVTPGFTIQDTAGALWFIKVDPPGNLAMATGTEVLVTKLFWALGYNVPENHIATLRPDQLIIGERATMRPPGGGPRRKMTFDDVKSALRRAASNPDGGYRVIASKALDGKPIGPFRFYGTRPDDPNDYVPHEHRRALRGYVAFAAWLNHVDSKSINSFDTLVTEDGRSFVRHHLLDFSSAIGSGSVHPREPFEGWEYIVEPGDAGKGIVSLGLLVKPWRTVEMYRARSVGAFPIDNSKWDPDDWRPRYANAAFVRARADDKFWAAQRLVGLTPELLQAVVKVGQFNDPVSEQMIVKFLIDRRQAVLRKYLVDVNPVVAPALDTNGVLTFGNAAVAASVAQPPKSYNVVWSRFDNATGEVTPIGPSSSESTTVRAPAQLPDAVGSFIKVEISSVNGANDSWARPVHAYFRRDEGNWTLVGFERIPDATAVSSPTQNDN